MDAVVPNPAAAVVAPPPAAPAVAATALALRVELAPHTFDADSLRAALEAELGVPVERVVEAGGPQLGIFATSASVVRVSLVRSDGSVAERTVDVSNTGAHANETLALVAANLVTDEAADLLAGLRARQSAVVPPPSAAVSSTPGDAAPPLPSGCAPNTLRRVVFGADVLPYVGMSRQQGTNVERNISLNLFGGVTGGVRGMELSWLFSLDAFSVCGMQLSGGVNIVGGSVAGAQVGAVNWTAGRGDLAQFGFANGVRGPMRGVQFGFANLAATDLDGAQFGFANVAGDDVIGAQFGLANVGGGALTGGQFGLANVSGAAVTGVQTGLVNVAARRMTGAQIGLVNVSAERVHGAMIGLVNTAPNADAALGLINVLWNGRTQLDVWGTDFGMFMVGVEHGSRYVHNITAIGIGERDNRAVIAPAYGIGARVVQLPFMYLDIDAIGYGLFLHDEEHSQVDSAFVGQLRVPVAWRILPELAVFVSPALNVSVAAADENQLDAPSLYGSARLTNASANTRVRLWPGFTLGARFF